MIVTSRANGWRYARKSFRQLFLISGVVLTFAVQTVEGQPAHGHRDNICLAAIAQYNSAWAADSASRTPATKLALEQARPQMVQCVDSADSATFEDALDRVEPEGGRLTKGFFGIPEYHDEGRLPTVANRLGPMAHIYASPFLGGFTRREQIVEQGTPGLLAAIVLVELERGDTIPTSYRNLGLEGGLNCVWLSLANAMAGTPYRAHVSTASRAGKCDRSYRTRGPLPVQAVQHPDFRSSDDYPPVARFDIDASGNNPVMAFKCLAAFCEVGPSSPAQVRTPWGLVRSDANRAQWDLSVSWLQRMAGNEKARRARVIKGWHDEQHLSVRFGDQWIRLNVRATITPETTASSLNAGDFVDRWNAVATLTLHDDPAGTKYARWGLRTGANPIRIQSAGGRWEAEIHRAANDRRPWIHTERMIHYDAAVPPTARFRWTRIDEGIWVPCGNACCRSDGGT